jgi:hypothetical protein
MRGPHCSRATTLADLWTSVAVCYLRLIATPYGVHGRIHCCASLPRQSNPAGLSVSEMSPASVVFRLPLVNGIMYAFARTGADDGSRGHCRGVCPAGDYASARRPGVVRLRPCGRARGVVPTAGSGARINVGIESDRHTTKRAVPSGTLGACTNSYRLASSCAIALQIVGSSVAYFGKNVPPDSRARARSSIPRRERSRRLTGGAPRPTHREAR